MSHQPLLLQPRRFHVGKTLWVLAVLIGATIYGIYRDTRTRRHHAWSGQTMGTTYSVRLADTPLSPAELSRLKQRITERLEEINRIMSHYRPDSELSRFNAMPAGQPFPLSPDFARVLRFGLKIHRASEGAFDPAMGALINAWGFGPPGRDIEPPDESTLSMLVAQSGARALRLLDDETLVKESKGVLLNLSAVAKGYGADAVAAVIREFGVTNFFVEIGGEVVACGHNPHGQPWRIGVESPRPEMFPGESFEVVLELTNGAVATSGDYRNFRTDAQGRRYAHILDPRTGRPVEHNLASVTVIAPDCMTADALATAAFVMGPQAGATFIEAWPDTEALFLIRADSAKFERKTTSGFLRYIAKSSL